MSFWNWIKSLFNTPAKKATGAAAAVLIATGSWSSPITGQGIAGDQLAVGAWPAASQGQGKIASAQGSGRWPGAIIGQWRQ